LKRKERIDTFLERLESQYPMDRKSKSIIQPYLKNLYDPSFPEDQIDSILALAEDTYKRSNSNKNVFRELKNDLEKITDNLTKITDSAVKITKMQAETNSALRTIRDKAKEYDKTMKEGYKMLEEAGKNLEKSNKKLQEAEFLLRSSNPEEIDPEELN